MRAVCFALGGHIATQNASFRRLIENFPDIKFYGAKNGFNAFESGIVYELKTDQIPEDFAGFVAGSGRYSLKENGDIDSEKAKKAIEFFRKGEFDIVIGSGGDDHGMQMYYLNKILIENKKRVGKDISVFVLNKTMDNDLGGKDGIDDAPYTDFTNGFHSAITVGIGEMHKHFSGAWTNEVPYIIVPFGRETNWVSIAMAYWGLADRIIYGEQSLLDESSKGHSIDGICDLINESKKENKAKYGREFAMIVAPEGTNIDGIQHISDIFDDHGNPKLNPEILAVELKESLEKKGMKTQVVTISYEMRNCPPTRRDLYFAKMSADALSRAIRRREDAVESVLKIKNNIVIADIAPIEKVSDKRYAAYYPHPLIDKNNFKVTDEIGKYYHALFGDRKNLEDILPKKLEEIKLYEK